RLFDRLPQEGDKIRNEGYEFIVKELKGLRISKVLVRKISASNEEPPEVGDESLEGRVEAEEGGEMEQTPTAQQERAKSEAEEVENELGR
ncbi:MAG: hypothetical protein B6D82_04870, partial [gamma proteobacterium symbiont of Ctena orbiculata]